MPTNSWTLPSLLPVSRLWKRSGVYCIVNNANGKSTCDEHCRRKLSERAKQLWMKRRALGLQDSAPLTTFTGDTNYAG